MTDHNRRGSENEKVFTTDDKMMMESFLTFISLKAIVSHAQSHLKSFTGTTLKLKR